MRKGAGSSSGGLDPAVVQDHLDDCATCRAVLGEAARVAAGQSGDSPPTSLRTLADGQRLLERYQIGRLIARGGMGEVYEASDSVLGERVALKTLLLATMADERALDRFLAEVRLARKVTHPNVCRILELGVLRQATAPATLPFLTMEFLEGEPLSARIARGPLPPGEVRLLAEQLIAGLGAIHAAGIVHRDFKSANVMLVQDGGPAPRAVIMDFGLARGLSDGSVRSSTAAVGTPEYMAPEQVEGRPATAAIDIYALGVVLFEALTGQRPFGGATPYLAALDRLKRVAPRPSSVCAGLDPRWDALVRRCLERDPLRRYQRVEEIAASIPTTAPAAARRWWPWLVGLAVASSTIGLAVFAQRTGPRVATSAVPAVEPRPASPAAPTPPPVAEGPAPPVVEAPAVVPASRPRRPARRAPSPSVARPPAAARPGLGEAQALLLAGEVARACALGEALAADQPSDPGTQLFLGKCYVRLGALDKARPHYRRFLELAPDAPDSVFVRAILGGAR